MQGGVIMTDHSSVLSKLLNQHTQRPYTVLQYNELTQICSGFVSFNENRGFIANVVYRQLCLFLAGWLRPPHGQPDYRTCEAIHCSRVRKCEVTHDLSKCSSCVESHIHTMYAIEITVTW